MTTSGSTSQQVSVDLCMYPKSSWLIRAPCKPEDTFVLLDALEADADAIRALAPRLCLEIGRVPSKSCFTLKTLTSSEPSRSGTGVISTFLAQIIGTSDSCLCSYLSLSAQGPHPALFISMIPFFCALSLPLYRHQPTRSDMYRAHRVPKQGAAILLPPSFLFFAMLWALYSSCRSQSNRSSHHSRVR
jgi:hypothetical protein